MDCNLGVARSSEVRGLSRIDIRWPDHKEHSELESFDIFGNTFSVAAVSWVREILLST